MLKSEYDELTTVHVFDPTITVDDLDDPSDRLLLYGYTAERETFAVAIRGGAICRTIIRWHESPVWMTEERWHVDWLYPKKRVYPEDSDAAFIRLLRSKGANPDILPWNEARAEKITAPGFKYDWE